MTSYDEEFYAVQQTGSRRSADVVLPIVLNVVHPMSLIDVGCGVGTWLASAQASGVATLVGVEGDWIKNQRLMIEGALIRTSDLERPIDIPDRFDLAICMEVAEHLSQRRAAGLVEDLVRLSDVVLFSAAVPGQGGTDHVNEQWQSYWAQLFEKFGYLPFDLIRPKVWEDRGVAWWYRQNALVYMQPSTAARLGCATETCKLLNIAHPEMVSRKDGPRDLLRQLPSAIRRAVEKRLSSSTGGRPLQ